MRVLVTGGAGFIGSVLVSALNDAGVDHITVVDNLGTTDKWKNLRSKKTIGGYHHKARFLELIEARSRLLEKPDVVFHLGACSSTTEQDADYLYRNNVEYSQAMCHYALDNGARFIYASSAATYGEGIGEKELARTGELSDPAQKPSAAHFSDDPQHLDALLPINRYGFSKHTFDLWMRDHGYLSSAVGLKFFNVFGPNEYHKGGMVSMVYRAFQQIQQLGQVTLFKSNTPSFGDGEQRRDFIYVKDCAAVMIELGLKATGIGGLFNLGTGTSRTWNELALATFAACNRAPKLAYVSMPEHLAAGYQNFTEAQMDRLLSALPGLKFTSLEKAVADYVKTHLNNPSNLFV